MSNIDTAPLSLLPYFLVAQPLFREGQIPSCLSCSKVSLDLHGASLCCQSTCPFLSRHLRQSLDWLICITRWGACTISQTLQANNLQFLDLSLDKKVVDYIVVYSTAPEPGLVPLHLDDCSIRPKALEVLGECPFDHESVQARCMPSSTRGSYIIIVKYVYPSDIIK